MCDCYREPPSYDYHHDELRYRLKYGYILDVLLGDSPSITRLVLTGAAIGYIIASLITRRMM